MLIPAQIVALQVSAGASDARSGASASQGVSRQHPADTLLARAESLLAAGQLAGARRIAEHLEDHDPDNARVLLVLGRIMLAWPTFGRFQAETLFLRAARLDPSNPEPLMYLGRVGLMLGGDDGEQVARLGLVPALWLNPDYPGTWALWLKLYRGERERRAAVTALAHHAGNWNADYWRAQLLIELEAIDDASALLEDVIRRRPDDPGPRAWLARARFEAGQDAEGNAAYEAALHHAAEDTAQVLWQQIRGIATPDERLVYEGTALARREAFFRLFWTRRTPHLAAAVNERLGEHFRRLAEAKRFFALMHPNSRYFRSRDFRAFSGGIGPMPGGFEGAEQRALNAQCTARLPSLRDEAAQAGLGPRLVDSMPGGTLNLEDGLDDRGRIYLRHGRPSYRSIGSLGDETWCYFRADGSTLRVTFVRRTGGYGVSGDMVVTPLVRGEVESAAELLATDRFDARDDLSFSFWPAAFRATDRRLTELLLIPDSVGAVAALVNADGREVARDSATNRTLRLVAPAGRYLLLLDATRGAHAGRYRGAMPLPDFAGDEPAVSSILIAAGDAPASRDSLTALAPHRLTLPVDQPLRVYAELYSMGRQDGATRYLARYRFERLDGSIIHGRQGRVSTIDFEREHPFEPRIVESLVVDPGRLPKGRYRLVLEITDRIRGTRAASAAIEFRLR